jgi:hypothetical protein
VRRQRPAGRMRGLWASARWRCARRMQVAPASRSRPMAVSCDWTMARMARSTGLAPFLRGLSTLARKDVQVSRSEHQTARGLVRAVRAGSRGCTAMPSMRLLAPPRRTRGASTIAHGCREECITMSLPAPAVPSRRHPGAVARAIAAIAMDRGASMPAPRDGAIAPRCKHAGTSGRSDCTQVQACRHLETERLPQVQACRHLGTARFPGGAGLAAPADPSFVRLLEGSVIRARARCDVMSHHMRSGRRAPEGPPTGRLSAHLSLSLADFDVALRNGRAVLTVRAAAS